MAISLPAIAGLVLWVSRPFPDQLASNSASISNLTGAQRANIGLAARRVDQRLLKPGENFSFNRRVGRRSVDNGFRAAPSYENGKTIMTEGGGICLLSSLLYKSALEAGLTIVERSAHSRPISSMAPGLDATVIFGSHDLVFKNNTKKPILIKCDSSPEKVDVSILGSITDDTTKIFSGPIKRSGDKLKVSIYREKSGQTSLISSDTYRVRSR